MYYMMYYMRMSKAENVLYENVLFEIMQLYMACGGGKNDFRKQILQFYFSHTYTAF